MQVVGNYAYVADYGGGLKIIDVSEFNKLDLVFHVIQVDPTNATQTEGDSGNKAFNFTVTRSGTTTGTNAVNWTVTGTGTNLADATDFVGGVLPSGTVTFAANSTSQVISISVNGDTTVEPNETFTVNLFNSNNGAALSTATGTITNDDTAYTDIESVGNTKFVKDATNKYFAQVGTATLIAIKNGGQQIYKDIYSSDWQTLAVETVNGQNQVLWKNVTGNYLHLWKMDSNWNWVSSEGQWALNSNDAFNKETIFGVDANGDGFVGNSVSLNLVGTSSNDTLIGGAKNDVLKGLGGKDILTGGLSSDRFDYTTLTDSLLANFDVITDFNATSNDLLVVGTARAGFSNAGAIANLDATAIGNALTNANFGANFAAQFGVGTRTFVAINDATAGFNQANDAIIEVTGLTGTLGLTNFVVA